MKATTNKPDGASKTDKNDAIALLIADHKKVKKLFKEFDGLGDSDNERKLELVQEICMELTAHTIVEEEIFYPAARAALEDEDLLDEADIEHASAKALIAQLQAMKPGDDHYDAIVKVLDEQIEHHVEEEEGEMFPKVKKAKVDTAMLGEQMSARKEELETSMTMPPPNKGKGAQGQQARR